jgi:hypothetical protein
MTEGPEVFIGRIRGEAKQLYSFWSKGIHCEFFAMGSHTLDDVTCIDKLRRSVHIVIEAAFVSQFVLSPVGNCAPRRALEMYVSAKEALHG